MAQEGSVVLPSIDHEYQSYPEASLTRQIIAAAIEVHRALGPGLVESADQACLCHELQLRGLEFMQQIDLPLTYKGVKLGCGYRIDLIVSKGSLSN